MMCLFDIRLRKYTFCLNNVLLQTLSLLRFGRRLLILKTMIGMLENNKPQI